MRFILFCFVMIGFYSCKSEKTVRSRNFSKVEIEPLLQDSFLNIRALKVSNNRVWFAGSDGYYGNWDLKDINPEIDLSDIFKKYESISHNYQGHMSRNMNSDSTGYELRAIAKTDDGFFTITAGSPSVFTRYKANDRNIVYKESHPKAFYDSMDFWNDKEGIAIGDPTDDCMSVIITRDGGETWTKLSCDELPKVRDGEAAFAASDTNISIIGEHTWVATGGKASRILYSPDKGKTWEIYDTPIIQGAATTGMYSIDFYDEKHGFAIGGDYTKPNDTLNNKIRTIDGGKTWEVVAQGKGPGYRSCVQYVPNSNAKGLVAVGFKGIDYSKDSGDTWKHLSDEGFYTIRFLNDSIAYAAGKGRISKLTFSK
ncbi:oxidoreductase [Winogradskyella sp. SYSU M77433]|uniref:WD40/YVTN/BNR-like repeat-containing protein n=1 Tax=Winogradskyella sp. SYSU M77433 TaxID=3042722 RepID=UPI002480709E|nr:oxidoreductase [Winogradskyella sp. SYSU M77433]MDH7914154.1 oxidoreductase [Winogradskyella sp. SYSU M77433]